MNKLSYDYVMQCFKDKNYVLLSKSYRGSNKLLTFVCPNGHKHKISWRNWQQGHRCGRCNGNVEIIYAAAKRLFMKENYILVSNRYINSYSKLAYICPKGHKGFMSLNNFKNGTRCKTCFSIKHSKRMSGEKHPCWKGGTSKLPYCPNWTKAYKEEIKQRDNYQCQNPYCYGTTSRLCVHHIDYTKTICGPANLITLCTGCNTRANKDRVWHTEWYRTILNKKYRYKY